MNAKEYFEKIGDSDLERMSGQARFDFLSIEKAIKEAPDGWSTYDTDAKLKKRINKLFQSIIDFHNGRQIYVKSPLKRKLDDDGLDVTLLNYFWLVDGDVLFCLPEVLRKEHIYLKIISENGDDWETYESNPNVRQRVDAYLAELNEFIGINGWGRKDRVLGSLDDDAKEKNITYVNSLSPDQVILYKYVHLKSQGKIDARNPKDKKVSVDFTKVRSLLNYIRRLLVQRKIGKETKNIGMIMDIQEYLTACTKSSRVPIKESINDPEGIKLTILRDRLHPAILLLKRYIGIGGRTKGGRGGVRQVKSKAKEVLDKMLALDLPKSDTYCKEIEEAIQNLRSFLRSTSTASLLPLRSSPVHSLSGFDGVEEMDDEALCAYEEVNGIESHCSCGR